MIVKLRASPTLYVVGTGAFHFLTIEAFSFTIGAGGTEMSSFLTSSAATLLSDCCNAVGATITVVVSPAAGARVAVFFNTAVPTAVTATVHLISNEDPTAIGVAPKLIATALNGATNEAKSQVIAPTLVAPPNRSSVNTN